ncbi:hypothetical protein Taro_019405 [Colocasia esculenta]|uniref:Uncharacterized protein n=1 Tax=Colocasia esculenta TaxID=4460 RepID=A0A843UTQ2_COLES|nr:hypothetical protein [Colocasia esculenta]
MAAFELRVLSGYLVYASDCGFRDLFLGAIRGGIGECVSQTSWRVCGPGCFCLWALDLVEGLAVAGVRCRMVEVVVGSAVHCQQCEMCVPRVASASCLTPLVMRESCVARP